MPADPWLNHIPAADLGGPEFAKFLEAFRDFQDALAAADPPVRDWLELATTARQMSDRLRPWGKGEKQQPVGSRIDLPGRGHPFLPPFVTDFIDDTRVHGQVVFRRIHLGGNGAAHGGALPLFFDEILGHLANAGDRPVARTAYLTVNFRHITPIGVPLDFDSTFDRQEGRKRWVSGRLKDGDTVVADAKGLFIQLRPGQP